MRISLLIGAGGSYGAEAHLPERPPLGNELYLRLRYSFPNSWGTLSGFRHELFCKNFELGMHALWTSRDRRSFALLRDMGVFFLSFVPPFSSKDLYTRLLQVLQLQKLLPSTTLATLNYDCLLDFAMDRLGFQVGYALNNAAINLEEIYDRRGLVLLKPHGGSNLVPDGPWLSNINIVNANSYYGGRLRSVPPQELLSWYRAGYSMPPAMSLYAPGKPSPMASEFIERNRNQWNLAVSQSDLIITIGCRPVFMDDHIWNSILASSSPIWFIGYEDEDYRDLVARAAGRVTHLGNKFAQGVEEMNMRLQGWKR